MRAIGCAFPCRSITASAWSWATWPAWYTGRRWSTPKFGEEICAWIKLRTGHSATPDEIVIFCKEQIAHYKIPKYVRFVDGFPTTVTGKIQKYLIRAAMIEELKLEEPKTA